MSKTFFFIHTVILLLLQLILFDNVQYGSLLYINIYILAVIMAPDELGNTVTLCLAFLLGLIVDIADNTMGIHAASATLLAYIRPGLLKFLVTHQPSPVKVALYSRTASGFVKYASVSTVIFFFALMLLEAFSFKGFLMTLARVVCSSAVSSGLVILYYYTAIRIGHHD